MEMAWQAVYIPEVVPASCVPEGEGCLEGECSALRAIQPGTYRISVSAANAIDCIGEQAEACSCEADEHGVCWFFGSAPEDKLVELTWEVNMPTVCEGLLLDIQ